MQNCPDKSLIERRHRQEGWLQSPERLPGTIRLQQALRNAERVLHIRMLAAFECNKSIQINSKWSVSGGFGARHLTPAKDYNGVNLGVTYALLPATSLDLLYYDTDKHEYGDKNKPHLVLKLSQKF